MPLAYLRGLTGTERTERRNRHLAQILALVAGAINAGCLFAVGQYTSHMSGIVTSMADEVAERSVSLAMRGLGAVAAFVLGAVVTTVMIRAARGRGLRSTYSAPLVVEGVLLAGVAVTGRVYLEGRTLFWTPMLLCFTMGLQNAMITKISGAVIRTTHLTGMITDMGISLGRLWYRGDGEAGEEAAREREALVLHGSLVLLFFGGGVLGAMGYRWLGYLFLLPCAAVVLALGVLPVMDDVAGRGRSAEGRLKV